MSRYKVSFEGEQIYFSTIAIEKWLPVFSEESYFQIIIDSLEYCKKDKGLELWAYVIMLDHLHLITHSHTTNLSDIMRDFKRHTSMEIGDLLIKQHKIYFIQVFEEAAIEAKGNTRFKIWQDGFHPEVIDSDSFFEQKLNYIHLNPVRKGYVVEPQHWKYSSARNWIERDNSVIKIDINPDDF